MPYLKTAQEWLTQSTLLLQARPSTTRITSKYTIASKSSRSRLKSKTTAESTTTPAPPPLATLTLKTYDPTSGVTLKYTTNKAAEVGRLIQILGRLARPMSGLPEIKEEALLGAETLIKAEEGSGPGTPALESVPTVQGGGKAGGQGGGQGGKKGKKKGKK
ncbi:uncharacterized protein PAC_07197 [Phialocephala subalpina]|uniref:SRP9 domain-containing protein n=1 Tax=Phialocephala subalpina TaxID=576137 RepID=A0A1L7WX35_9HELO|nr:uncharacterized protein PAC_07197 [Phialocephala subalpina]